MRFRSAIVLLVAVAALFAACADGDGDGGSGSAATSSPGGDEDLVELELTAEDTRFDRDRLAAPAGSEVSVTLNNKDSIEHNFSLYEPPGGGTPLSEGALLPGPAFLSYQFTAPEQPGNYRFQCDVHPEVMNGDFVAE